MEKHHRQTIERMRAHFSDDPRFAAILVGGSIVKDRARPDSDVDALFIATDEEFERRQRDRDHLFLSGDFTDYPGGYIDGKVINLEFLRDVAERGSEPARWAFVGVEVVCSRIPELENLVRRIVAYPRDLASAKVESFFAQVRVLRWFVAEAERHGDRYLLYRSAAQMALFAGRLVLVQNEILFPSHKWFLLEVRNAPQKPEGFCELLDALLERPCDETAGLLEECVAKNYDPGLSYTQIVTRFMEDSEWNWRDGRPPLEDC
jgi:predicted nucleotidyltransferase